VVAKQEEADRWESLAYGSEVVNGDTVYLMSSNPTDKAVFIQTVAEDGTTNPMSFALIVGSLATIHNTSLNSILLSYFTPISSYAFLVFILLYSPCLATLATIKKETGSWSFMLRITLFLSLFAWAISFLVKIFLGLFL
jgi:Fe2+ transport system protein B